MDSLSMLGGIARLLHNLQHPSFSNYEVVDADVGVLLDLGHRRGAVTDYWNPLSDSLDCFVLAAYLRIDIVHRWPESGSREREVVCTGFHTDADKSFSGSATYTKDEGSVDAAIRLAVTRAAFAMAQLDQELRER